METRRNIEAELNNLYLDCMNIVKSAGINPVPITDVSVNRRAKTRFGQCRYHRGAYGYTCSINISIDVLDALHNDKNCLDAARSVMVHEILHAANIGEGHKGNWKRDAEEVMRLYPSLNISRCGKDSDFNIVRSEAEEINKYCVVCDKCGYEVHRNRRSKLIDHPGNYIHRDCGGHFKLK